MSAAILHWDGTRWNDVAIPALSAGASTLDAIDVIQPDDIWAVGSADQHPLALHWNGTAWTPIDAAPVKAYSSQFVAVAALSPTDVWAVGNALPAPNGVTAAIVQHWDGHTWQVAAAPAGTDFYALKVSTNGTFWGLTESANNFPQLVRWENQSWQQFTSPDPGDRSLELNDLAVSADASIWVGGNFAQPDSNWAVPFLAHWDGHAWTRTTIEEEARGAGIDGLAFDSDGALWAAGTLKNPNTRLNNIFMRHVGGQPLYEGRYPLFYNDPQNGDSFSMSAIAAIPGTHSVWIIGSTGVVPDTSLPPIDANLPKRSGAFSLNYC